MNKTTAMAKTKLSKKKPLITAELRVQLLKNGAESQANERASMRHLPLVKLFNPTGAGTWLISELDPDDDDIAFGLCDLGMGSPEMGSFRVSELENFKGLFGLGIERDKYWKADKTLVRYADAAWQAGRIVS